MKLSNITYRLKYASFFTLIILAFSCKNDQKSEVSLEENRAKSYDQNDGYITMKGDYVYYSDAAVLQTKSQIYGVVVDDNLRALEKQVEPYKKDETDMVSVTLRVRKFEKPEDEDGWQYRVEIKDILSIEASSENKNVIKLENTNNVKNK